MSAATDELDYPESWLPQKNSDQARTLVGKVADYALGPDFEYGASWICTVVDVQGKPWSVWIGRPPEKPGGKCSVLWAEFDRHKPEVGETVTIRYRGYQDKPRGGGPSYHKFAVTVDRGQALPEFLQVKELGAGEDPPEAEVVSDDDAQKW